MSNSNLPIYKNQGVLDLEIEIQQNVDGIEMGVLENGIPYLTQTGLASLCGVARSVIYDITKDWENKFDEEITGSDRNSVIKNYLFNQGFKEKKLHIETRDGNLNYAYPDYVCMAILEYYTFDSQNKNNIAASNYRKLARFGFEQFIYKSLEYKPADKWQAFHDRVLLSQDCSELGYFIIFKEINGMVVDLIKAGLIVNAKTVPDISVGRVWAEYWKKNKLSEKYGEIITVPHNYPSYFPQASANPNQINAYPDAGLPEFRRWFKEEYLPTKFPAYILKKANVLHGGKEEANKLIALFAPQDN
ncbi:Bacteriophage CII protein [Snodgrassella alvi SCGC AB-598-J21]|uniref:Bacteriophage CII protein n=1 Tax=Snodgrassella alvi SCGC AB-598-J21 TaxID=1385367 RepID=A0A074V512_9NEIS|nr:hypothetical protein [Snodgrassella alvi]KEQ00301.1 Bacteriophage CII protein [Snodgrassella alvi SCGC AB-598-J21]PXY96406.1 hypothetical protein DKK71_09315 [Snodgrassella alvi]